MAIRLTESRLRQIVREESSKLNRHTRRRLSEMPVKRGRYFSPEGEDMGDFSDVEFDIISAITQNPSMASKIDPIDPKKNLAMVSQTAMELGYPDIQLKNLMKIAEAMIDIDPYDFE